MKFDHTHKKNGVSDSNLIAVNDIVIDSFVSCVAHTSDTKVNDLLEVIDGWCPESGIERKR